MDAPLPPLWRCPRCRRAFANRNQSHTCRKPGSLVAHFKGKPVEIRQLFDEFSRILHGFGPVIVMPEKTRIAFQVRMSFGVAMPRLRWLDGHLILARRAEHPRFRKVETFSPRNHLHAFRLTALEEIDEQFRVLMREAYAVGEQRHLE